MSKQVMQRALDALALSVRQNGCDMLMTGEELRKCEAAIAELRAEIAKPEVEPVGYTDADGLKYVDTHFIKIAKCFPPGEWIAVYTAPPDTEAMRKELDDGLKDRVALAMELERVKGERDAMAQALAHIASFDPWEPAGPATHCAKYALSGIAAQGGGE